MMKMTFQNNLTCYIYTRPFLTSLSESGHILAGFIVFNYFYNPTDLPLAPFWSFC